MEPLKYQKTEICWSEWTCLSYWCLRIAHVSVIIMSNIFVLLLTQREHALYSR